MLSAVGDPVTAPPDPAVLLLGNGTKSAAGCAAAAAQTPGVMSFSWFGPDQNHPEVLP